MNLTKNIENYQFTKKLSNLKTESKSITKQNSKKEIE